MRSRHFLLLLLLLGLALAAPVAHASEPGTAVIVDQPDGFDDPLTGAGGPSGTRTGGQTVSADGRFVVFTSSADGLSDADDDAPANLFRKDRVTGAVELVSVSSAGVPADDTSNGASISDDGTRVAFSTGARNLDPAATDGATHVFVRDLQARTTTLVSRANGALGTAASGLDAEITGDGTGVVFVTVDGLDPADKNQVYDVYLRKLAPGSTLWVSRANGPAGAGGAKPSYEPAVNATGTMVAFTTQSSFDDGDQNGLNDVYRRWIGATDTDSSTTELISVREVDKRPSAASSDEPSISADGYAVAFRSDARDLDTAAHDGDRADIYLRYAGDTMLVSGGGLYGGMAGDSSQPDVTGDRAHLRVAFRTLVPESTASGAPQHGQVGVRTMSDGSFVVASQHPGGGLSRGHASSPALARDAGVVVFDTRFADLGTGIGGDYPDVVARELGSSSTELVSGAADGPLAEDLADAFVRESGQSVTPDGRFAVFVARHDGLGVDDRGAHVFRRDLRTGRTVLIDRRADGSPSSRAFDPAISADGTTVVYATADRLLPVDTNDEDDIYLTVVATGETRLVSRAAGGGPSDGSSWAPAVDADGGHVAFASGATNLSATADSNARSDVFLHDVGAGTTQLVSRAAVQGNRDSGEPALSADGRRVAFVSAADNLLPEDKDDEPDVYVRDLGQGTIELASLRTDGTKVARDSYAPMLSADGRRIAFASAAQLDAGADTDTYEDVYLRDLGERKTVLVSRATGVGGVDSDADAWSATISPDGSAVAFQSRATNLGGGKATLYVRRIADATTTAVGSGSIGGLSTDAACLLLVTAHHPVVHSSGDYDRVVLQALTPDCDVTTSAPGADPGPGSGPGGAEAPVTAPVLSDLSLRRARFRVGRARTAVVARGRTGTAVQFRLNRAASVSLTVQQRVRGRWVRRGALQRAGRAGANRVAFSGRVGRRALRPGRYRFAARARDAQGRASAVRHVRFRVVR